MIILKGNIILLLKRNIILHENMGEHLCLQWADFRENVDSAFGRLRYDKVFADVTLACEDGQQMDAHKVILAASSPIFEEILQKSKHPHPMIYLRGPNCPTKWKARGDLGRHQRSPEATSGGF